MSKRIIGLVGPIASGKDTVKKYLIDTHHARDVRFSSILRDVLTRIGVEHTRTHLQRLSTALRATFGEDTFARAIARDAERLEAPMVVLDGVRRQNDITHLIGHPDFLLVAIDAPSEIRYQRMVARNENAGDREKSYEQFLKDHEYETEVHIPEVMAQATVTLDNRGSFTELYAQIEQMLGSGK